MEFHVRYRVDDSVLLVPVLRVNKIEFKMN
jgi:hypothetical protein